MDSIRPCPFCGREQYIESGFGKSSGGVVMKLITRDFKNPKRSLWAVMCSGCGAEGPPAIECDEAVAKWNKAPRLPAVKESSAG